MAFFMTKLIISKFYLIKKKKRNPKFDLWILPTEKEEKKGSKNKGNKQKTDTNMLLIDIHPAMSRITLNISGLNSPIKR